MALSELSPTELLDMLKTATPHLRQLILAILYSTGIPV